MLRIIKDYWMQSPAHAIDPKRLAAISAAVQAFVAGETPPAAPPPDSTTDRLSEWRRAETLNGVALESRPRNWTTRD